MLAAVLLLCVVLGSRRCRGQQRASRVLVKRTGLEDDLDNL
jgi:hypothetical protein